MNNHLQRRWRHVVISAVNVVTVEPKILLIRENFVQKRYKNSSQAHHLRFYQFIFELCDVKMTKINKERPGMAHIKKEKHLQFTCNVIKYCYGCGAMWRSKIDVGVTEVAQDFTNTTMTSHTVIVIQLWRHRKD